MTSTNNAHGDNYNVTVSGTNFELSRHQIQRDAPNYFTSHFFDGFQNRIRGSLELSRDPDIFKLVIRYLNGYQVVPLQKALVPSSSTVAATLTDLLADAQFFQLDELIGACKAHKDTVKHAVISGYFKPTTDKIAPAESFDNIIPRFSLEIMDSNLFGVVSADMRKLTKNSPANNRIDLTIISGWSRRIAESVILRHDLSVSSWKVLGWDRQFIDDKIRHVVIYVELRT